MLLTETIKNSIQAIEMKNNAAQNKSDFAAYSARLSMVTKFGDNVRKISEVASRMHTQHVTNAPVFTYDLRQGILDAIDACGNGIAGGSLTDDAVYQLREAGNKMDTQVKAIWKDEAPRYSNGVKGYLSLISGLTTNPTQSKELVDQIDKIINGTPTLDNINQLVMSVAAARQITKSFTATPEITGFLQKVSSHRASVADLTPNILDWLQSRGLMTKVKLVF